MEGHQPLGDPHHALNGTQHVYWNRSRRPGLALCVALVVPVLLAAPAPAQGAPADVSTSLLIRLEAPAAHGLGPALTDQGFDVLPPSVAEPGLRLIVTPSELAELESLLGD